MRADIVPGAVFPDYELPDHTTKRRKLSELQGQHPMVLVLSRGSFCQGHGLGHINWRLIVVDRHFSLKTRLPVSWSGPAHYARGASLRERQIVIDQHFRI